MQQSRGGMGSTKHGKSGSRKKKQTSPKLRHALKREAEQDERLPRRSTTVWKDSVSDAFRTKG